MLKRVERKPEKSRCPRCFANRVRYISNQEHPHHKLKKDVQPAINLGCRGPTPKDFIKVVHECHELGKIRIANQSGGGNPTKDIFFEVIYSAPEGLRTTAEERAAIDKMITEPFRNCPIRHGWHLAAWGLKVKPKKWKPLDDAHYLISARDRFGKATISERFGAGSETLESWRLRMDQEICDMLSLNRTVKYEPVRPIYLRRLGAKLGIKFTKLHEMIACHTLKPVTRENLADVIDEMQQPSTKEPDKMVPVAKVTNADRSLEEDKLVRVHFMGRKEPNKYRIKKLLLDIAETQLDIELARPDGHEDHDGGAGGESGGGSGGLDGVASAATQPASPESATSTPKAVSSPPTQAAELVQQPEPESANLARKKSRWRPKPQPKGPTTPGKS